ncbi:MAG: tetratricopeptide repeat protein [Gammaproteobacteria bacterium]|nr:MAG: tetratricopeptide repeat protein [Gammaproteobacteria bacterium]
MKTFNGTKAWLTIVAVTGFLMVSPVQAQEDQKFLDTMVKYLEITDRYVTLASEPAAAVFFAMEGIVELYEQRGETAQAIPHLERLLEQNAGNPVVENIVRFKLRDLYRDTGQGNKALAQLDRIFAENARAARQ